jgi:probable F420-dependent oxidoreductase
VVLPVGYQSDHPPTTNQVAHQVPQVLAADSHLVDVWVALAAVATSTRSLHLATGMFVLPMRHPVAAARAATSLAELSDGRFWFGVGAGWLREEFEAVDAAFSNRGERLDEAIEILRAAWSGGPFRYEGHHYRCAEMQVTPTPVHVPLILGGNSPKALRRAVQRADGYFSSGRSLPLEDTLRLRDELERLSRQLGRTEPLPVWCRVGMRQLDELDSYRSEGLNDIVIRADELCTYPGASGPMDVLTHVGRQLGLQPRKVPGSLRNVTVDG